TPSDGFWTDQDPSSGESLLSTAVRLGVTCFDTAQSYGKGRTEQVLGKILRRFPDRKFIVDTKIMPSSKSVADVLKPSLKSLNGVDIDCLYLHWPSSIFDCVDYLRQMSEVKESGLCRKVGVCNLPLEMLSEYVSSGVRIDRIQRPVSLLWSRELSETLAFCRQHGIEVAAYSPTGMGLLSGKYQKSSDLTDARADLFCFDSRCIGAFHALLSVIRAAADKHGCSCTAVSLAWVRHKGPDILILGARNQEQLRQNLETGLCLSESEISDLDLASQKLEEASRTVCENIFSYRW
ncbi:MAG: aldo/keto reductase, partial [Spirochaetales bacterium]|nr:aldo/keto reductase [Spirochaetales bacterium]